jgi:hypothetical protein
LADRFKSLYQSPPDFQLFSLYCQAFATFCKSKEFVVNFPPALFNALWRSPADFTDMTETFLATSIRPEILTDPENSPGWNCLKRDSVVTFLSHRLLASTRISIQNSGGGFAGVVSDAFDRFDIRFKMLSLPSVSSFLVIDFENRRFEISVDGETEVSEFPDGGIFRAFVAPQNHFVVLAAVPEILLTKIDPVINTIHFQNNDIFYEAPSFAGDPPIEITDIPKIEGLVPPIPEDVKQRLLFIPPPDGILLHISDAQAASNQLIKEYQSGAFKRLGLQWITIALIRIAEWRCARIRPVLFNLFATLIVALEPSVPLHLESQNLPFYLGKSAWSHHKTRHLPLGLDCEFRRILAILVAPIEKVLEKEMRASATPSRRAARRGRGGGGTAAPGAPKKQRIVFTDSDFVNAVGAGLLAMSTSRRLHLGIGCKAHRYFSNSPDSILTKKKKSIVCFNDFLGPISNGIKIGSDTLGVPLIVIGKSVLTPIIPDRSLSILEVSNRKTTWIQGNGFQLLLLLKNFVSAAKSITNLHIAWQVLLNCYISKSPFIYRFLPEFSRFMQFEYPLLPFSDFVDIKPKLTIIGGMVHAAPNPESHAFYTMLRRVVSTKLPLELATHQAFRSFFISPEHSTAGRIPAFEKPVIDPGAIISEFASPVIRLAILRKPWPSLLGFPFWEVFMLWHSLKHRHDQPIDNRPTVHFSDNHLRIVNWDNEDLLVELQPPCGQIRRSSIPNGEYLIVNGELRLPYGVSYLIGDRLTARTKATFPGRPSDRPEVTTTYVMDTEVNEFKNDMIEFAINWTKQDWNDLRSCLSPESLYDVRFGPTPASLKSSRLAKRPPIVLDLKRLLLHHVHYIFHENREKVPDGIWALVRDLIVVGEDPKLTFLSAIKNSDLNEPAVKVKIDCRAADRHRVLETEPSSSAMISQLSGCFRQFGAGSFRHPRMPIEPELNGAVGISDDLFGEVLEKACASIFQGSSQLMVACQTEPICFVPWAPFRQNLLFEAIGILIGIIVRTRRSQNFPLAEVVWKYLAGETTGHEDILRLDPVLQKIGQGGEKNLKWEVTNWNGLAVILPGHDDDPIVHDVDLYIDECVSFRQKELRMFMHPIRAGMRENLGLFSHPALTGELLCELVHRA